MREVGHELLSVVSNRRNAVKFGIQAGAGLGHLTLVGKRFGHSAERTQDLLPEGQDH